MNYEIVLATHNAHKVKEVREILSPFGIIVYGLSDLNLSIDVEEDGHSYEENALKKAEAVAKYTSYPIIADDSGLEVDALNNFPGLYSSRYIESCGSNITAMSEILDQLEGNDNTKATFHCCICLINVEDKPLYFEGEVEGNLVPLSETSSGFGYDAFFKPKDCNLTYSQMSDEEKNAYSHRGKALKKLLVYLRLNGYIGK